jgi:hypothetical protein
MASSITHLHGLNFGPLTALFDMISHTMDTIVISYHLWVWSDHISFPLHICSHLVLYAHTHTLPMPLYPPDYPLSATPMARGGRSHSGRGNSSAPRGRTDSRLIAVAENSTNSYHAHTPPQIQAEINLVEADVRVLRRFVTDEEVRANTSSWVPDTGGIRSRANPNIYEPLNSIGR